MSSPQPIPSGAITGLLSQGVGESGIGHVLRVIRKHLRMDVAFISRFREVDRVFEHVDAEGVAPIEAGQTMPLEDGYCMKVVRGELPECIPDTSLVPAALAIPATRDLPIGAHLSIPVRLERGEIYGTLCCFSHAPDTTLGQRDMSMLRAFADVLAARIDEGLSLERFRESARAEIRAAMDQGIPRMVYQPIYGLASDTLVGVECLARFDIEPRCAPDIWFNAARQAGVGLELELFAIVSALRALDAFPNSVFLGVNTSPELVLSGKLAPVLERVDLSRIVIEITEHATVNDYAELCRALAPLRERGARLAIDDAGAGYASMRHILDLKSDIIKLDMSLTHDIDADPSRRALAKGLISFAHEIETQITAEGVETRAELDMLRRLGADKVQGYYLSKPLSLDDALAEVQHGAPPSIRAAAMA